MPIELTDDDLAAIDAAVQEERERQKDEREVSWMAERERVIYRAGICAGIERAAQFLETGMSWSSDQYYANAVRQLLDQKFDPDISVEFQRSCVKRDEANK